MGSIKRSVDINDREVRLRFAKISKASWAELYFDLYRQCFGEDASEEACMQDAEHRLQTLKANFPERYGAQPVEEEWSNADDRFILTAEQEADAHAAYLEQERIYGSR